MDTKIIANRRVELEALREGLSAKLDACMQEMNELDIAEKVINRLSPASEQLEPKRTYHRPKRPIKASGSAAKSPSVREVIKEALMDARQRGVAGLTPQGIRDYAKKTYKKELGPMANTVASRMWREAKEIEKDVEAGLFMLPRLNEAAVSASETKAGEVVTLPGFLNPNPAHHGA